MKDSLSLQNEIAISSLRGEVIRAINEFQLKTGLVVEGFHIENEIKRGKPVVKTVRLHLQNMLF